MQRFAAGAQFCLFCAQVVTFRFVRMKVKVVTSKPRGIRKVDRGCNRGIRDGRGERVFCPGACGGARGGRGSGGGRGTSTVADEGVACARGPARVGPRGKFFVRE